MKKNIKISVADPDLKDPNHFARAGSGSELTLRIYTPDPDLNLNLINLLNEIFHE